jgi:alcohol dehydrogenase (NADP+)
LKVNAQFLNVSAPDWNFPEMHPMVFLTKQIKISGSLIGSPSEIEEMLEFAAEKGVRPWIDTYPMSEVNKAIEDFRAGKPRFRFVLEN